MAKASPMRVVAASGDAKQIVPCIDSITLTGPPGELVGSITLRNESDDHVVVHGLSLSGGDRTGALQARDNRLRFRGRLAPREEQRFDISTSVAATQPPGTITDTAIIGGKRVAVRALIQALVAAEVEPNDLYFVGVSAGQEHRATLLVRNRGNVPIQIPNLTHSTALDMDAICRNLSKALRFKGDEGTIETLDEFFAGMKKDLAGAVKVAIEETGQIVMPGDDLLIEVVLTLPGDVDETLIYNGSFRLFEEFVVYTIVPAAV